MRVTKATGACLATGKTSSGAKEAQPSPSHLVSTVFTCLLCSLLIISFQLLRNYQMLLVGFCCAFACLGAFLFGYGESSRSLLLFFVRLSASCGSSQHGRSVSQSNSDVVPDSYSMLPFLHKIDQPLILYFVPHRLWHHSFVHLTGRFCSTVWHRHSSR